MTPITEPRAPGGVDLFAGIPSGSPIPLTWTTPLTKVGLNEGIKPATQWLKSYWDEEDVLFYFEADEDGRILRQVELQGPMRTPIAAASLNELPDADTDGVDAVREYEERYGGLADQSMAEWDADFPHEEVSAEDFEGVWQSARASVEGRS